MASKKLPADSPYLRPIQPRRRTPEQQQARAKAKADRGCARVRREQVAALDRLLAHLPPT
jgi:hypothetical protein